MNYRDIEHLDDSKFFGCLLPVKRVKPIKSNPVIVGWDTEYIYRAGEQIPISVQFAHGDKAKLVFVDNKFTTLEFMSYLDKFLSECGYGEVPSNIYLVSHFSQADIANFDNLSNIKRLFQSNGALFGEFTCDIAGKPITVFLRDLYAFFNTSLERIGVYVGLPKVSLHNLGGYTEDYWKSHMAELSKSYPCEFESYALQDARIAYYAYSKLREFFLESYQLDILDFFTRSSLASYIFRRDYLREPVTKTKIIDFPVSQKKCLSGNRVKYYETIQKKEYFDGDFNVRLMAMLCYHGARTEAFFVGRFENVKLSYLDADSLYPSSAILQPLPVSDTEWVKLPCLDSSETERLIQCAEGFVEVRFSFPSDCLYPCLPVCVVRDNTLCFPLSGVSHCTLSELRVAIKLGLTDFSILSGYCFIPTKREINHYLADCLKSFLSQKRQAKKGTVDYEMYKLLVNALIGKLRQGNGDTEPFDLLRDGVIDSNVYHRVSRKAAKSKSVGELWIPEWASLILGKSRAIIGEFCALGAYFVSTDSVLLPANVDLSCDALQQLRSVGSDLKTEIEVTHGVIIRNRLYSLNPMDDLSRSRHTARHSVHMKEKDFLAFIREGYLTKVIPSLDYSVTRFIKLNDAVTKGKPLNSEYVYNGKINLAYDNKRVLLNSVDNPFAESSWTRPLTCVDKSFKRHPEKTQKLKRGRKPRVDLARVFELVQCGMSQLAIAKELGTSQQNISKILKKHGSEFNALCITRQTIKQQVIKQTNGGLK
jgi:hypothetical protein